MRSGSFLFAAFVVLLLLGTQLPVEAAGHGPAPAAATKHVQSRVSSRLQESHVAAFAQGKSDPDVTVTVVALPGTDGRALAKQLKALGYDTRAVGARSVDLDVRASQVQALASQQGVAFVDEAVAPIPLAITEGRAAMRADVVQGFGFAGENVSVAVIDLGFDPTSPEISSRVKGTVAFDGSDDVTLGYTEHGTACAEIVVDVAPKADLYLLKATTSTEIENAFDWAIANGIDVVSMSLGTIEGPFDGTSAVSQAVTRASDAGILVVLANGNNARHHWAGPWADPDGDGFLSFEGSDEFIAIDVSAGQRVTASLSWDAFPVTYEDYDLLLMNQAGTVVAGSINDQAGSGPLPPQEALTYVSSVTQTMSLLVPKWLANGTSAFHLFLSHDGPEFAEYATAQGSIVSPADAVGAISVGAADHAAGHALHSYSSQGPTDDGRMAPLFVSAAGVTTEAYAPQPFYGTSASAPHVAGGFALLLSATTVKTRGEVLNASIQSAIDLDAGGPDNATGHGWMDLYGTYLNVTRARFTGFSPASGVVGKTITLRGSGFADLTQVRFNGTTASFTILNDTTARAVVPLNATSGTIRLRIDGQNVNGAAPFTLLPKIDAIAPSNATPGSQVNLTGAGLTGATRVRFNGTDAAFTVANSTLIQATVPANATSGAVQVTTPGGTATSSSTFLVKPRLDSFTPTSATRGSNVTVRGAGFLAVKNASIGATGAAFTILNDSTLRVVVPQGATTGRVHLGWTGGVVTSAGNLTITIPTPTLTSFFPARGVAGTNVTINGTNLTSAASVSINGAPAAFTVVSATKIVAVVPKSATTGRVMVSSGVSNATLPTDFIVDPVVARLSATSGAAGDNVTIDGAGIANATRVRVNGVTASFTILNATTIRFVVPDGATSGLVDVRTSAGTASSPSAFVVNATLRSISPSASPAGRNVTVLGTGLANVTSVKINGTSAPFVLANATALVVQVPAQASSGNLVVTANGRILSLPFKVKPTVTNATLSGSGATRTLTLAGSGLLGAKVALCSATSGECFDVAFVSGNATAVQATVGSDVPAGQYRVLVQTPGGSTLSTGTVTR